LRIEKEEMVPQQLLEKGIFVEGRTRWIK
jgi:hypothetical protein